MDLEENDTLEVATRHEDFVDSENNCCLCGSDLAFEHETDLLTLTVREEAHCPTCGVQLKEKEHILH